MASELPANIDFYRVEHFTFNNIDERPFFIKEINNEDGKKIDFKGVPNFLMPQVYKKYKGLPICDYDLLFYYEGFLSKFQEPLYPSIENKKSKKMI